MKPSIQRCFASFCLNLALLGSFSGLFGQNTGISFEHIPIQHGQFQLAVTSILQDQQGFIWIGTNEGLHRYNGYKFTSFVHDPDNPNGLKDEFIRTIYEDRSGNIWVGTNTGGLFLFDKSLETFEQFPTSVPGMASGPGSIWVIHQDQTGSIWLGTHQGLIKLNTETRKVTFSEISPDKVLIRDIDEDQAGNLWLGTGKGLAKITFEADSTVDYKYYNHSLTNANSVSGDLIRAVHVDQAQRVWIGTREGVNMLDPATQKSTKFHPRDGSVSSIFEDKDGSLWIGTSGEGLIQLFPSTERFIRYSHDPLDPESVASNSIWRVFQDRSGLFWIGTDRGLQKMTRSGSDLITYSHQPERPGSLSNNTILSLYEGPDQVIWIGTENGLNLLDPVQEDPTNPFFRTYYHQPGDPQSLSHSGVSAIYRSQSGIMWLGTKGGGLNRFDPTTGVVKTYQNEPGNPNSISSNSIRCIFEYPRGVLWLGTREGLNKMDLARETFVSYRHDPRNSQSLSNDVVMNIHVDGSGVMWVGTRKGLNSFDPATGVFRLYSRESNPQVGPLLLAIFALHEDTSGTLYAGTSKGLAKLDRERGVLVSLSGSAGLPMVLVKNILEDDLGNLWLNTDQGVIKYHPTASRVFSYFDNAKSKDIKFGTFYKTASGEMLVAGPEGLKRFSPQSFLENKYKPPVVITDFQVFNRSVKVNDSTRKQPLLTQHISRTDKIDLPYTASFFSFEFAALNYMQSEKNQYKYKMEGFNDDWIVTNADKRFATYTNLDPGDYTFRVIASNNDGEWNEDGTSIALNIQPPPWESPLAYILYALLGVGVIFMYLKNHQKKLRNKQKELELERLLNERLQHADKLKDDFLANTSHELRTPLNGIIGIAESLFDGDDGEPTEQMKEDLSLLIASGKRLSSMVNSILDFSKLKTRDLTLRFTTLDLHSMVNVIMRMSAPLIEGKDLVFANRIPVDTPLVYADENRLMQILNNLISNAIKFTEAGMITVSAKAMDDMMAISVSDTGIGIPENKRDLIFQAFEQVDTSVTREFVGTGLGLSISKALIELHSGTIEVESKVGEGSIFTFTIPISSEKEESASEASQISKVRFYHSNQPELEFGDLEPGNVDVDTNILVVDDDPINQRVLVKHLNKSNYNVTTAFNGEEALLILETMGKFDLVLLDIMMPKMSGFEVCQKIREKFSPAELPVILITAKNQVTDLVSGFSCGANDYIVKPFSRDEFLSRVKTHLELLKINTAYSRFIPVEFLKSLGRESILDVKLGDQIQQEITVFFCDIRSYSTLSESMTPRQNFNFLNAFLRRVGPLIKGHGGFVNQYLGDGIMALFLKSATDSVKASIAIQKAIREYNSQRLAKGRIPIDVGIGLHNGPLMMGIIGDEERMDPGVVSDTVNTAARMEGLTKYYGALVIISEDTLAKIENPEQFNYRELGKVQVKGKRIAVKIYEIYDGDPEEILELKQRSKEDFESGLYHFFNKNFTEAASAFKEALKVYPNDKTSQLYLKRSAEFMVKGVPESWSGVEAMSEK